MFAYGEGEKSSGSIDELPPNVYRSSPQMTAFPDNRLSNLALTWGLALLPSRPGVAKRLS